MFSRLMHGARATAGARTFSTSSSMSSRKVVFSMAATAALGVTMMALSSQPEVAFCAAGERKNSAFLFIKPHAVTEPTKQMVTEGLKAGGLTILTEGDLTAKEIDERMLIDNHYYAIASKATILQPKELNVPPELFKKQFGLEWKDALAQGVVYNAKDACVKLGLDANGLNKEWAKAKKAGKLVKFGGGFYCGLIEGIAGQEPMYVFNGFFMNMRDDYVKPGASLHYYVVEWDAAKLSWDDFRGSLLGPTDPAEAPTSSLRGKVLTNWKQLGLASMPNVGDNGIHASASPFEAMAERCNWLGATVKEDPFGKALLEAGIPEATIKEWSVDPTVVYGAKNMPIKKSLFDTLEDTNSDYCLALSLMVHQTSNKKA